MSNDLRVLAKKARVGGHAHPWGSVPLIALLVGACSSASKPEARSVQLSADFAVCGQCDTVEVVLLRGEPPACVLARTTLTLPTTEAGPQIDALEEPLNVAVWAACRSADPTTPPDAGMTCAQAVQVCASSIPGGIPGIDPSQLVPFYESLCDPQSQSPLQQCCAVLLPCLNNNSPSCEQEIAQCAQLLGVPYAPGQIDITQIKELVQAYCAPNSTASAECCAALDQCVNGVTPAPTPTPAPSCVACRVMQRVGPDADQIALHVERAESCERPSVLDLPDC